MQTAPPPPPSYAPFARARHLVDVHRDISHPKRPLGFLIPGAVTAIVALAMAALVAWAAWGRYSLDQSTAVAFIAVLGVIYIGGVYLFAYGYELQDARKALRLTAIIVLITVAAVFIVAVLAVVLGALGGGRGGGSSSSGSSHSGSSGGGGGSSGSSWSGAPFLFLSSGGGRTRTVVNTVTQPITCPACHREFVPQKGAELQCPYCHAVLEAHQRPVECPYCQASYVPQDNQYACPKCHAPTPPSLLVQPAPPPPA